MLDADFARRESALKFGRYDAVRMRENGRSLL